METEKLIAALRETQSLGDAPVGLFWGVIVTKELVKECIDALERLTAKNVAKDAEIERLKNSNEVLRAERDELHKNNCGLRADRDRLQAELDAAVDDLKIASDCATCDMRGEKGFSACAPLFAGDEQSCKNYKWRGKEHD
ncbi:hypothetical protein DSECCO2_427340 [anaerobic digester metagenome]